MIPKIKPHLKLIPILILLIRLVTTKEHVVFERIGMMAGATSFIHVHVTLGIDLMKAQADKYRDLLNTNFNTTSKILDRFAQYGNMPDVMMTKGPYPAVAKIWKSIADQHRLDLLDIYVHLESLRNTMPDLPDKSVRKIHNRQAPKRYQQFSEDELIRLSELEVEMGLKDASEILTHRYHPMPVQPPDRGTGQLTMSLTMSEIIDVQHMYHETHNITFSTTTTTTSTTTTTTPPSTRRPQHPRRQLDYRFSKMPFQNILDDHGADLVVDAIALAPSYHHRRKRMAGIIALPMAVAATAMGIYNTEQINFLKVELTKLQENQERLFDIVSRHEQALIELSKGFDVLLHSINAQLIFNPALFGARLSRLENQIRDQLRRVTHALQAGLSRKLAVDYLTPNEIRNLYSELITTARNLKCDLLINHHSDLFQLETSLLFDGNDAHLLIHVPMVPHQALLRLYKLHPIPLPLNSDYFLIPDVKNDVLAISTSDSRYAVQLSSTDLMGCYRAHQMFMCDRFGVLTRGFNDTCLGSLYSQQFQTAQNLCRFEVAPITERVYQLEKHHFLVYLPHPMTVPIRCRNGSTTERHLTRGHQDIHVSPGCEAEFNNHKIMTDSSITFPADVLHYEWIWDPISITNFIDPGKLPQELQNLLDNGITRPTLADLQFMAVTRQKIQEMVKPEDWGLNFIHTMGSATLGICLIGTALFVIIRCCRRRQKSKLPNSPSSDSSTSNVFISTAPPPPSNPALDSEDVPEPAHPLANDPRFRKAHRKAPSRPDSRLIELPSVRFNVKDETVTFPYQRHHQELAKEGLLQQRDEISEAFEENTDLLARHRSELVGKLSELDTYLCSNNRKNNS